MNIDTSYFDFIQKFKQKIYSAKSKAIFSANKLMIELYFEIGKEIIVKQDALGWGKSIVEQMSKDLIDEFGEKSGYSASNLWRMRIFYLSYKDNEKLALLNDTAKMPHENLSIGIILCTDKDKLEVEYALQNVVQPMGISTYTSEKNLSQEQKGIFPEAKALKEQIQNSKFNIKYSL